MAIYVRKWLALARSSARVIRGVAVRRLRRCMSPVVVPNSDISTLVCRARADAQPRRSSLRELGQLTSGDLGRSIPRNILLCCYEVGPTTIRLCCKYQELLVVAFGLATISGPFGRLCGTRKGAIAVRIITQRRLEFLQRLRGFIGLEQQFAEQFPDW